MKAMERFWNKVSRKSDGCWVWIGAINSHGYGNFGYKGKTVGAHCFAYEMNGGEIPKGLELDHLCRVRHCVNPDHLEPVTHQTNSRRGNCGKTDSAKTHCPQGHEYNEENTRRYRGRRYCRACINADSRRRYALRKALR